MKDKLLGILSHLDLIQFIMRYYCGKSWVRQFLSLFMNIDIKILKYKN